MGWDQRALGAPLTGASVLAYGSLPLVHLPVSSGDKPLPTSSPAIWTCWALHCPSLCLFLALLRESAFSPSQDMGPRINRVKSWEGGARASSAACES